MNRVFVAGIGQTKFGKLKDKTLTDLIEEAGALAIQDSTLAKERIQAAYVGNFNGQQLGGQGHLGPLVTETLEISSIPAMRIEAACASGGLALLQGANAIRSGLYDVVLVGGAEKMTHRTTGDVTGAIASAMNYELEASTGLSFPGSFALIANRYFEQYGDAKEAMAQAAVIAHDNALKNPHAQMQKAVDIDTVLSAPYIADPIGLYDCSLVSDGAAFMVLVSEKVAEEIRPQASLVEVAGSGHGGDALTLAGKDNITSFNATLQAASQAYAQAGITAADVDLAEVHDCFTITQIINIEDLGFFPKGEGGAAILEGRTRIDGGMPINTSGGLKAKGHPIGATGISQGIEIVLQLRNQAGERQVKNPRIGLTHNLGGTAATCVVTIYKALDQ